LREGVIGLELFEILHGDVRQMLRTLAKESEATFPISYDGGQLAHLREELAELEAAPHSGEEVNDRPLKQAACP
jgi:hypothetical protein